MKLALWQAVIVQANGAGITLVAATAGSLRHKGWRWDVGSCMSFGVASAASTFDEENSRQASSRERHQGKRVAPPAVGIS